MGPRLGIILVLCLAGLAFPSLGCKKGAATETKAFATASPEAKAMWESTKAAIKTNGLASALVELQALRLRSDLTPDQEQAVDQTSRALSDQLYKAADAGDKKAQQELEALRSRSRR